MDIKNILEYQNAVIELEKVNESFTENDFYVTVRKLQIEKKRLEGEIESLSGIIKAQGSALDTILNDMDSIKKELEYLSNEKLEELDESSINENLKYLEKYEGKLNDLFSQNKEAWKSFVEANRANSSSNEKLNSLKLNYEPLKPEIQKFNNKYKLAASEVQEKIKKAESKLNEEEKAIYSEARDFLKRTKKNIKGSQSAQVFVKSNNGCCKCGIELDPADKEKLLSDKYFKCQNCGRIVYID